MEEKVKDTNIVDKITNKLIAWKLTGNNLVYAIGCILMAIASFMPYVYSEQQIMSLMDGNDGIFFLMFAVLIFIFISFEKKKTVGILGLILTYLGAYELFHTYGVMSKTGQAIVLKSGYYVLFVGTLIVLVASSYFVYRNGLKDIINRIFDRFFPVKESK